MALIDKRSITTPRMVYQIMLPSLKHLDHEESWVLYLNRAGYLLGKERITVGRLETTLIDTPRIVRKAIETTRQKGSSWSTTTHLAVRSREKWTFGRPGAFIAPCRPLTST